MVLFYGHANEKIVNFMIAKKIISNCSHKHVDFEVNNQCNKMALGEHVKMKGCFYHFSKVTHSNY